MLRPSLSRHHLVMLIAVLLGAFALALGNLAMFGIVVASVPDRDWAGAWPFPDCGCSGRLSAVAAPSARAWR